MMATYPFNATIRLSIAFTQASLAYDPTSVVLKVASPNVTETAYVYGTDAAVQKDATGAYHLDLLPGSAGLWSYRWEGNGVGVNSASENTFFVQPSVF